MNDGVNIRVEGTARVESALAALSERTDRIGPALGKIGFLIANATRKRFVSGATPWGGRWRPLSATTLGRRRKQGRGAKPLRDTGALMDSITSRLTGPRSVEVGTALSYAGVQQFGARKGEFGRGRYKTRRGSFPIPWGDIPARPFLPIQPIGGVALSRAVELEALDYIGHYLGGAL